MDHQDTLQANARALKCRWCCSPFSLVLAGFGCSVVPAPTQGRMLWGPVAREALQRALGKPPQFSAPGLPATPAAPPPQPGVEMLWPAGQELLSCPMGSPSGCPLARELLRKALSTWLFQIQACMKGKASRLGGSRYTLFRKFSFLSRSGGHFYFLFTKSVYFTDNLLKDKVQH